MMKLFFGLCNVLIFCSKANGSLERQENENRKGNIYTCIMIIKQIIVFQICGYTPFVNLLLAPCGSDSDCATGYKCDNGYCKRGKLTKTKFLHYIKYNVS